MGTDVIKVRWAKLLQYYQYQQLSTIKKGKARCAHAREQQTAEAAAANLHKKRVYQKRNRCYSVLVNTIPSLLQNGPAGREGMTGNQEDNDVLGLATIRRNRGITLEQIAEMTKISKRSLEAIERGEFRKLPGGIYNTSYIRQYARAIDYDESAILAVYARQMGPIKPGSAPSRRFFGGLRPASSEMA